MKIFEHKFYFISAAILATSLICYSGGFQNNFLPSWDDSLYVSSNPDIQSINLTNLKKIWTSFYVGNYAPVQMFSYMLDYQIWGVKPFGFILTNVIFHGLNGILFFLVASKIFPAQWWALFGALIFIVHPVQVESVVWISQRKNVLSMTFFLSAMLLYINYCSMDARKGFNYLGSVVLFGLSLLAKPITVILPVILIGYDVTLRGNKKNCFLDKIPYIAMAIATSTLALISQSPERGGGMVSGMHGGSFYATAITMLTVYKKYLINIFLPVNLSAYYDIRTKNTIDIDVIISILSLSATVATLWLFPKAKRHLALFWLLFFLVAFIPVSQIVPIITLMNDRYLYFPMLGCCGYAILLLDHVTSNNLTLKKVAYSLSFGCLLILGSLSWQRSHIWKDTVSLWQDASIKQPGSVIPWYGLALYYDKAGNTDMAIKYYRHALKIQPDHPDSLYNLGLTYLLWGNFHLSQPLFENLVRLDQKNNSYLQMLALNYYALGNYSLARTSYERALDNNPKSVDLLNLVGLTLERLGQYEKSKNFWNQALATGGKREDLLVERARVECVSRRIDIALNYIEEASLQNPGIVAKISNDEDFTFLRRESRFINLIIKNN